MGNSIFAEQTILPEFQSIPPDMALSAPVPPKKSILLEPQRVTNRILLLDQPHKTGAGRELHGDPIKGDSSW